MVVSEGKTIRDCPDGTANTCDAISENNKHRLAGSLYRLKRVVMKRFIAAYFSVCFIEMISFALFMLMIFAFVVQ